MKRPVIVWVDEGATYAEVVAWYGGPPIEHEKSGRWHSLGSVPVPSDDQLTRDIFFLARVAGNIACGRNPLDGYPSVLEPGGVSLHDVWQAQARVRAAFDLDEGSE